MIACGLKCSTLMDLALTHFQVLVTLQALHNLNLMFIVIKQQLICKKLFQLANFFPLQVLCLHSPSNNQRTV